MSLLYYLSLKFIIILLSPLLPTTLTHSSPLCFLLPTCPMSSYYFILDWSACPKIVRIVGRWCSTPCTYAKGTLDYFPISVPLFSPLLKTKFRISWRAFCLKDTCIDVKIASAFFCARFSCLLFASFFVSIPALNFHVSTPLPAYWESQRVCCLINTIQYSAHAMSCGFLIPLFTSILVVSILEPLEASEMLGVSAFLFVSTLAASASGIFSCVTNTPPSLVPPFFTAVRLLSCLKDTLEDLSITTVPGFSNSIFCQPCFCLHLPLFSLFLCDRRRVSVCRPLLNHFVTTITGSTILPYTQTICLGVILSRINVFYHWGGHMWYARCCVRENNQ